MYCMTKDRIALRT